MIYLSLTGCEQSVLIVPIVIIVDVCVTSDMGKGTPMMSIQISYTHTKLIIKPGGACSLFHAIITPGFPYQLAIP